MVKINNLPLYLVFYILPIISAVSSFIGFGRINYEILWFIVLFLLLLLSRKFSLPCWSYSALQIILVLTICKYIIPYFYQSKHVYIKALSLDYKWIYYLILSIFWTGLIGKYNINCLYKCGRNFAILYVAYVLLRVILNGHFSRECANLLDESNYDCFLLLIPFCFIESEKHSKYDYIIFITAILLSTSKTGAFSLISLLYLNWYRRSKHKIMFVVAIPIFLTLWAYLYFIARGVTDVGNIDRALFFMQFFEYIKTTSWSNLLCGAYPGVSMQMTYLPAFEWYIENFQEKNNIIGCYPFYFHSTYMRIAITWGLPFFILGIIQVLKLLKRNRYVPLNNLIIVFLLESISLSSLSLVNVSFIFMTVVINAILYSNHYSCMGTRIKNVNNLSFITQHKKDLESEEVGIRLLTH